MGFPKRYVLTDGVEIYQSRLVADSGELEELQRRATEASDGECWWSEERIIGGVVQQF